MLSDYAGRLPTEPHSSNDQWWIFGLAVFLVLFLIYCWIRINRDNRKK